MIALVAALLLAGEPAPGLGDAVQALHAGRLEQARLMLDTAIKAGAKGDEVDRLLAEHAYLSRDWGLAFARYEKLAALHPNESLTLERAGIAAFQLRKPDRAASYAKRFAAKEACAKALGTGFRAGVFWRDMGVVNLPSGKPTMQLTGGAARRGPAVGSASVASASRQAPVIAPPGARRRASRRRASPLRRAASPRPHPDRCVAAWRGPSRAARATR